MLITARERIVLLGLALGTGLAPKWTLAKTGEAKMTDNSSAQLAAAWSDLCGSLEQASHYVQSHPYFEEPQNHVSAYAMMVAVLVKSLEVHAIIDPDFPVFHIHDAMHLSSADNPDQRYLTTRIRGGESYRIWGHLTNEARLDIQIYAGEAVSLPRSTGFLRFEDLHVEEDGSYEIIISPDQSGRNWMDNPVDSARVLIRQVYSNWTIEAPGEVHIDRIGYEGARRLPPSPAEMAKRMREVGQSLVNDVEAWATLHQTVTGSAKATPVNDLPPPASTFAQGGAKERYMTFSIFDVADDEALVLRWWPMGGSYQSVHLRDLWNSSLEYMNMQSSLTAEQCHPDPDGSYWCVLAARDPGVPNWLDTGGLRRGYIAFRFDGIGDRPFDEDKRPTLAKVPFDDVRKHLPAGTAQTGGQDRFEQIALRRRHLQERCHR